MFFNSGGKVNILYKDGETIDDAIYILREIVSIKCNNCRCEAKENMKREILSIAEKHILKERRFMK